MAARKKRSTKKSRSLAAKRGWKTRKKNLLHRKQWADFRKRHGV